MSTRPHQARSRALPTAISVFVGLLWVALLCLATGCHADIVEKPLCGEVLGFAGEFNDHIVIPISHEIANEEAVVLVARAFPLNLGFLTQGWLRLSVTYRVSAGAEVVRGSDDNGILVLSDVASGSSLEVRVERLRKDGPVPFRFFSMQANSVECFVSVAPDNLFYAPLPPKIRVTDAKGAPVTRDATYFFKSVVPAGYNAASIHVSEEPGGLQSFSTPSEEQKTWVTHGSGELVPAGAGGAVVFSYSPEVSGSSDMVLVRISTTPGVHSGDKSTAAPAPDQSSPSPSNGGVTQIPSSQPLPTPPSRKQRSVFVSFLRTVFLLVLVLFVAYMIGCTYYNVRVRRIRDFPEMIPFIDKFRACGRAAQLCFARATGRPTSRVTGEYNSLDDEDFYK